MATLDIRGTIIGETALAIKAPCVAATTGTNITLNGVQTIDGVTVGNNAERVLVKDQTIPNQNGIYIAATGPWRLAADFQSNNNVTFGTLVLVTSGAVNAGLLFEQTCPDSPIVIGTSNIGFAPQSAAATQQQQATSATSIAVGTGARTFAIQSGKAFQANQWVLIQETQNAANQLLGQVTSYSGTALAVNVTAIGGSGTHADWTIVLTNSAAAAGYQPPVGSGNVTGPGSAASGHVAAFADSTGKVIQDGGALGTLAGLSGITAQFLMNSAVNVGANMVNGTIVESVASNAITFAIKTLAGNDPSASDPAYFIFRNLTASLGGYGLVTVTSALSVTVPASSTLGFANATPGRLWIVAINNSGTVQLGVINCLSGTSIYPLQGWNIASFTAFGAGANSAQVFYAASSVSGARYCVLGYATWEAGGTMSTAGNWADPTRMQIFVPGIPLPGQIVQIVRNASGAAATGSGSFTSNNTVPANTNGTQFMSQAVTPSSSANVLTIEHMGNYAHAATSRFFVGLFQDSTANALAATEGGNQASGQIFQVRLFHAIQAATLSQTTFKINAGDTTANVTTFNGEGGSQLFGGALNSFLEVREIAA